MSGAWLGELGALVGKCASCRFSGWSGEVRGAGLECKKPGELVSIVRPNWSCRVYEYEPGSVQ